MGLILTTDSKGTIVYRKDKVSRAGNSYSTFSTKISSKTDDGNWISAWYELKFPKNAVTPNDRAKINIKNSFPVLSEYNGNTQTAYMVMDFEVIEEGTPAPSNENAGFMNIPDDGDLPFAAPQR